MQKKIQIKTRGFATIFKKAALQYALRWLRLHKNNRQRVHRSWIESIESVATCHPDYPKTMIAGEFAHCYFQFPDLAAALLNFMRQKWSRLERSKAGKLKKFLSSNTAVKWVEGFASREAVEEATAIRKILKEKQPNLPCPRAVTEEDEKFFQLSQTMWANRKHSGVVPDEFGNVSAWALQDGELAASFEHSPGGHPVTIYDVEKARKWVVKEQLAYKNFAEKVLDKDGFLQVKGTFRRRK